jgi:hypothetical protein
MVEYCVYWLGPLASEPRHEPEQDSSDRRRRLQGGHLLARWQERRHLADDKIFGRAAYLFAAGAMPLRVHSGLAETTIGPRVSADPVCWSHGGDAAGFRARKVPGAAKDLNRVNITIPKRWMLRSGLPERPLVYLVFDPHTEGESGYAMSASSAKEMAAGLLKCADMLEQHAGGPVEIELERVPRHI